MAKDPGEELRLVIGRDKWRIGFDALCMHAKYIDKPMQGRGTTQVIARANRVFKGKPAGLCETQAVTVML